MRPALHVIRPEAIETPKGPWYQARWLKTTWKVANALVEFTLHLAVAVIAVALMIFGAVLMALGVGSHFVGGPRR